MKVLEKKRKITSLVLELNEEEVEVLIKAVKKLGQEGKAAGFDNATEQMVVVELNEKLNLF